MLAIIIEKPRPTSPNISGGGPTNKAFLFCVVELQNDLFLEFIKIP